MFVIIWHHSIAKMRIMAYVISIEWLLHNNMNSEFTIQSTRNELQNSDFYGNDNF